MQSMPEQLLQGLSPMSRRQLTRLGAQEALDPETKMEWSGMAPLSFVVLQVELTSAGPGRVESSHKRTF